MSDKHTAYHEAGHAAADLLLGHSPCRATIVATEDTAGTTQQLDGDNMTAEGMENLVIALYAGAEAQSHVDVNDEAIKVGASDDDEQAAEYLRLLNSTEEELRERTTELISEHWELVELIASELLLHKTLQYEELVSLFGVYLGEETMNDMAELRVRLPGYHEPMPQEQYEAFSRECSALMRQREEWVHLLRAEAISKKEFAAADKDLDEKLKILSQQIRDEGGIV